MENYNFKVDLKGLIRLLSENLYSSDRVFLRELLQNAVDAIDAAKKADSSYGQGKITVTYKRVGSRAEINFEDNGIGLTKDDIHSFLSIIGQSSKRGDELRNSFIGQFGIGLLSCFLVTNEIIVITRSITEEKSYQWIGKSDGTYDITESAAKMEPGTRVSIKLEGAKYEFFTEQEIINALSEYGFLIKTPIFFQGENFEKVVNNNFIPWRQSFCMADEIMSFGEQIFAEMFFDVVPLIGDNIKGYAYISKITNVNSNICHKIFLKNMYVTDDGRDLIPKWAFFTRCIVNVDNLTPTASREGFAKDSKLMKAKNQIEKCIFDYFVSLSQYDVRKLKQLTQIHNVAIKSLAADNEQILKMFFPFLTFPSSQGILTGFQIVKAAKKMQVSYCVDVDEFRRISPLLEGTKSLLINGGYIYDSGLLQQLPKLYKNVKIDVFDNNSYMNILEDAPADFVQEMETFRCYAQRGLEVFHCSICWKSFSPNSLQALFVPAEDDLFDDAMDEGDFSDFFGGFDFGEPVEKDEGNKLYLNCNNSFIRSLGQVYKEDLARNIIQVIYIQALLAGHYTLDGGQMELMNKSLQRLMEYALYGE